MKSMFALACLVGFTQFASADSGRVFKAQSDWSWDQDFGSVDTEGARLNAIELSYRKCVAAGNTLCELVVTKQYESNVESDGRRHLRYEAVVEALDSLKLTKAKTYTKSDSTYNASENGNLSSMAAKANALSSALDECYSSGAEHCVILGLDYIEVNRRHSDGNRYTTAEASVRGYTEP